MVIINKTTSSTRHRRYIVHKDGHTPSKTRHQPIWRRATASTNWHHYCDSPYVCSELFQYWQNWGSHLRPRPLTSARHPWSAHSDIRKVSLSRLHLRQKKCNLLHFRRLRLHPLWQVLHQPWLPRPRLHHWLAWHWHQATSAATYQQQLQFTACAFSLTLWLRGKRGETYKAPVRDAI
jgi:hypothetical protein